MALKTGLTKAPHLRKLSIFDLVRFAVELGAADTGGQLSPSESGFVQETLSVPKPREADLALVRNLVADGQDPLGQLFIDALSPEERRPLGAVYTQPALVQPMVNWAMAQQPARIVDAGAGSGRYALAAARANPSVDVIAVDLDPVATLLCRANIAMTGAHRVRVVQADYTTLTLPGIDGRTAYIGNPPYVRHHELSADAKAWAKAAAEQLGLSISGLAGLHAFFYLATALHARADDVGCYVTSAEWLEVGYGRIVRELVVGRLGGQVLHLVDALATPFAGAMTTALVACFQVGNQSRQMGLRFVRDGEELGNLAQGHRLVARVELASQDRWRALFPTNRLPPPAVPNISDHHLVPLGSLVRVSRGIATGANDYFVMTAAEAEQRGLTRWARPAVTSAQEVFSSPNVIHATPERKVLIDLTGELALDAPENAAASAWIQEGVAVGVCKGYLCSHRKPWWRLGAGQAPPVVATYMARQAPMFARNPDGMLLLNIAHGFYPKVEITDGELRALVHYLNGVRVSFQGEGRTYHGGLEKFEPKEMERLLVPSLEWLREMAEES